MVHGSEYADIDGASLDGAYLPGANLHQANLRHARLRGAHLEGASLTAANLLDACLVGADLTRANLTGAHLNGAVLAQANVSEAVFASDLRRASVTPVARRGGLYRQGASLRETGGEPATNWPPGLSRLRRLAPPIPKPKPAARLQRRTMKRISDGDSVVLQGIGPAQLASVNAPPLWAGGRDAAAFLRRLKGDPVRVGFAPKRQDEFGRRFVYLWHGQRLLNAALLAHGLASTIDLTASTPYQRTLLQAEERAKEGGLGVWRHCPSE